MDETLIGYARCSTDEQDLTVIMCGGRVVSTPHSAPALGGRLDCRAGDEARGHLGDQPGIECHHSGVGAPDGDAFSVGKDPVPPRQRVEAHGASAANQHDRWRPQDRLDLGDEPLDRLAVGPRENGNVDISSELSRRKKIDEHRSENPVRMGSDCWGGSSNAL